MYGKEWTSMLPLSGREASPALISDFRRED
jgi:hypothetical protein